MNFFLPRQRSVLRIVPCIPLLLLFGISAYAAPPAAISVSISASNSGKLTCSNKAVTLTASATGSGVAIYRWTGPNSYSATAAAVTVTTSGIYKVTVANSAGLGTASTTVESDTTVPANVTATSSGPVTCLNPSVTITASSTSSGVSYSWTGPHGFTASSATAPASVPGGYLVTAMDNATGCKSIAFANVFIDTAVPTATISSVPANNTITCINTQVVLTGSPTDQGMSYSWTGPNNFTATGAAVTVTTPGNYILIVTNPANGCLSYLSAPSVTEDVTIPSVNLSVSDKLSCNATSVTLTAQSLSSGTTYTWTGPNGFSTNNPVFNTSTAGRYTLTAVIPANGCMATYSITAKQDTARPAGLTATNSGPLTCDITTVTLTGNSTTPGVYYIWFGPNGFFDNEPVSPSATDSGTYILTATNPENGCVATGSTYVAADFTACSMVAPKVTSGTAAMFNDSAATQGFSFKVYPNPMSAVAYVEFRSPTASQVSVGIYNNMGVLERVLFSNAAGANQSYRLMLDPGSLAAGIHYCQMRIGDKVYTRKLLLFPNRP